MKNVIILLIIFCASSIACQAQEKKERRGFAISVNSKFDEAEMSKEQFRNAVFGVHSFYPEMVGRVGLKGFSIKYSGQKTIVIIGDKLNEEAIRGLKKVKVGNQIVLYDAISKPDGDYPVEIRGPMLITVK